MNTPIDVLANGILMLSPRGARIIWDRKGRRWRCSAVHQDVTVWALGRTGYAATDALLQALWDGT